MELTHTASESSKKTSPSPSPHRTRKYEALLRCPACEAERLSFSGAISCLSCKASYSIDDTGVLDLVAPQDAKLSPEYYGTTYKDASRTMYEKEYNYFENGNSVFNAIHFSGHKTMARWAKQYVATLPTTDFVEADLGSGSGAHAAYYHSKQPLALDLLPSSLRELKKRTPGALAVACDQMALPIKDATVDIAYSVYSLEHVFHLRLALHGIHRILKPEGRFYVSIPCEGGLAWNLGRQLTSRRHFEKIGIDYMRLIRLEHCNTAKEVIRSLSYFFETVRSTLYPLKFLPWLNTNLVYTVELKKKVVTE